MTQLRASEHNLFALVDDSIVRGTTSQKIVQMVREAGAAEVHFRSASPPIKHPDFYDIDMPSLDQLMAAQLTLEEMRKTLGVDTLGFLSIEGLYWAMGEKRRDKANPQFTGGMQHQQGDENAGHKTLLCAAIPYDEHMPNTFPITHQHLLLQGNAHCKAGKMRCFAEGNS